MASKAFLPRRGRKSTMVSKNPILRKGEFFIEVPESGVGTGPIKIKVGDGIHEYADLPYAIDLEDAISSEHLAETLSGTQVTFAEVNIPSGDGTVNERMLGLLVNGKTLGEVVSIVKTLLGNIDTSVTELNNDKAPNDHSSTSKKYGVATDEKYGHVKISGDYTEENAADDVALSTRAFSEFNKINLSDKEENSEKILDLNEAIKTNARNIAVNKENIQSLGTSHDELVERVDTIVNIKEEFDSFVESTNERLGAKDEFQQSASDDLDEIHDMLEDGVVSFNILLENGYCLLTEDEEETTIIGEKRIMYSGEADTSFIGTIASLTDQVNYLKQMMVSVIEQNTILREILKTGSYTENLLLENNGRITTENGIEILIEQPLVGNPDAKLKELLNIA